MAHSTTAANRTRSSTVPAGPRWWNSFVANAAPTCTEAMPVSTNPGAGTRSKADAVVSEALLTPATRAGSPERWWCALGTGEQRGVPPTHGAGVAEGRASELERGRARIGAGAHIVPVQYEFPELLLPACGGGRQPARGEVRGRRMGVGVERGLAVASIARPPADRDLLRVHRVARDELVRRGIRRRPGEQVHGHVERPPPRVDRRGAPAIRRAKLRQRERHLGDRSEVRSDRARVVGRVLVILVQGNAPPHLLRGGIDLNRPRQRSNRVE